MIMYEEIFYIGYVCEISYITANLVICRKRMFRNLDQNILCAWKKLFPLSIKLEAK